MFKKTICLVLCVLLVTMIANTEAENGHCACKVTRIRNPVCGSDNQTYDNESKIICKNRCEKTNIKVKHEGECK